MVNFKSQRKENTICLIIILKDLCYKQTGLKECKNTAQRMKKLEFAEKIFGGESEQTGAARVTRIIFIKIAGNNTRPTRSSLGMQCEKRGPQIITRRNSCLIYPGAILSRALPFQGPIKAKE